MGVQNDAAGYLAVPRLKNSTHGLMAVQIAASEMERGARRRTLSATGRPDTLPAEVGRRVAENFVGAAIPAPDRRSSSTRRSARGTAR